LGVSSGAGLGVALFILGAPLLGWTAFPLLQSIGIIGSGWIGTAVILLGVAVISRKVKNILGVLIMGVMTGYVAGAIIQILQYMSSAEQLKVFTLWSMGSLGHITMTQLAIMAPIVCIGLVVSIACIKPLNLLLLGENYARTMGMNIVACIFSLLILAFVKNDMVNLICIGAVGFFASSVFSIIYSMALQARPEKANQISGLMITAVAGGGVVTPVIGFAIGTVGVIGGVFVTLACVCYLTYCAFGVKTVKT
jgi:iron complex transport system permease protein